MNLQPDRSSVAYTMCITGLIDSTDDIFAPNRLLRLLPIWVLESIRDELTDQDPECRRRSNPDLTVFSHFTAPHCKLEASVK